MKKIISMFLVFILALSVTPLIKAQANEELEAVAIQPSNLDSYEDFVSNVKEKHKSKLNEYKKLKSTTNIRQLNNQDKKNYVKVLVEVVINKLELWKKVAERDFKKGILTEQEYKSIVSSIDEKTAKVKEMLNDLPESREDYKTFAETLRQIVKETLEEIQSYLEKSIPNRFKGAEIGIFPRFEDIILRIEQIKERLASAGTDVSELEELKLKMKTLLAEAEKEYELAKLAYTEGGKTEDATKEAYREHFKNSMDKIQEAKKVLDEIKVWLKEHNVSFGNVMGENKGPSNAIGNSGPGNINDVKRLKKDILNRGKNIQARNLKDIQGNEREFCQNLEPGREWRPQIQGLQIKYDTNNKIIINYGDQTKEIEATKGSEAELTYLNNKIEVEVEDLKELRELETGTTLKTMIKLCVERKMNGGVDNINENEDDDDEDNDEDEEEEDDE